VSARYRVGAAFAAAIVIVVAIVLLSQSYNGYSVRVLLADAGGLQSGSNVNVGGVTVGNVSDLTITKNDRALATLHINNTAAPIGQGAHATVQIDGFFGERIVELSRGDYQHHSLPSGSTIPVADSGVSVRLDDVVNALDFSAQGALQTFLDEQGTALVGRGQSLASVLARLPQTLPAVTQLLNQFSANQQALGDLVDRSNRVVAQVAAQRQYLGQMINSANGAFSALSSRRSQLGQTVQTAPGALKQAQTTLATLHGAAIPLSPAADGLRATAPSLTNALHEIPRFANAAVPTLNEVATVSPALQRLADAATPIWYALVPLTRELTTYSSQALAPLSTMLADKGGAANLFGEMEGWARSTQGFDASSHIFRFGATIGPGSFAQLLSELSIPGLPPLQKTRTPSQTPAAPSSSTPASTPAAPAPAAPKSLLPPQLQGLGSALGNTVNGALGLVQKTTSGVAGALVTVLHPSASTGATGGSGAAVGQKVQSLLGYILGK
jgi:phospholipid/cholesterol/gamma-HCH transport system substrate-binding protein